ncbi:hypothetical protein NIES267_31070 [Calothrix parasitica NIES-267]|uniref:Uncharacterized protein n=1 Tax=Calothrix parasitica NIES-267 TaxID=1973488 RepID=A0A1Z4LR91_9CYAN|nr:hypothetical protein NIES267_31070 [Calothrix parasitica NIES-267]
MNLNIIINFIIALSLLFLMIVIGLVMEFLLGNKLVPHKIQLTLQILLVVSVVIFFVYRTIYCKFLTYCDEDCVRFDRSWDVYYRCKR